jgi:class 3 adenylate cyclase
MSEARVERRLAAILAVDVAGCSRLMGEDEEGTLAALRAVRRELADPKIAEHRGRGVNITARLEALAEPGGICLSAAAHEQVRDRLDLAFDDLGEQQVKNITRPVRTYGVVLGASSPAALPARAPLPLPDKPSLAVLPFQNMTGDAEQEYFVDGMVEEIRRQSHGCRGFTCGHGQETREVH